MVLVYKDSFFSIMRFFFFLIDVEFSKFNFFWIVLVFFIFEVDLFGCFGESQDVILRIEYFVLLITI